MLYFPKAVTASMTAVVDQYQKAAVMPECSLGTRRQGSERVGADLGQMMKAFLGGASKKLLTSASCTGVCRSVRWESDAFRRPDRSRVGVYLIGALFRQDICLTVPALVGLWPNCAVVVFDGRPARPIPLSKAGSPDGR